MSGTSYSISAKLKVIPLMKALIDVELLPLMLRTEKESRERSRLREARRTLAVTDAVPLTDEAL